MKVCVPLTPMSLNSPVNEEGALPALAHSRSRAEWQRVVVGGAGGEVFLPVLDPGEAEPLRVGERVDEVTRRLIILSLSGEPLGNDGEADSTVGHVL